MNHVTRKLPCTLTNNELLVRGSELAEAEEEIVALRIEAKIVASDFKERINAAACEVARLARIIKAGKEDSHIDCFWEKRFATQEAVLIRDDTGEIVERRTLTKEELQEEFVFKEEKAQAS